MTQQLAFLTNYERMVAEMLAAFPEAEAMDRAVGGNFERFGTLEHCLLRQLGLQPNSSVMDVGCGSGRLAVHLGRYPALRYQGTDIVASLLAYAQRLVQREDFRFTLAKDYVLPEADNAVDFVTFFSVFTHLLHEESYAYLQEALRVLRPGGKVVFSFLDPMVRHNWPIFEAGVDWVRRRSMAGHLNVFMHLDQLRAWLEHLPGELELHVPGDQRYIEVPEALAVASTAAGSYAFGQSIAVVRKVDQAAPVVTVAGAVDNSASPLLLGGWTRIPAFPDQPLRVEVVQRGRVVGQGVSGTHRADVGNAAFTLELSEPLDEEAVLLGFTTVHAMHAGRSTPLAFTASMLNRLRYRQVKRFYAGMTEAERKHMLAEIAAGR